MSKRNPIGARASLMRVWISAIAVLAMAAFAHAGGKLDQEHELKAQFIKNFVKFIDWPDLGAPGSKFVVGVYGADDYQETVEQALKNTSILGHPILVEQIHSDGDVKHCRVVVSGATSEDRIYRLGRICNNAGTVLIGDADDFVKNGGTIGFHVYSSRIRFDVNLDSAKRSGVTISSKLLQLAHEVYREGD